MELLHEQDTDTLAGLEERVLRAVETVTALKREKSSLEQQLATALSERDAALADAQEARDQAAQTAQDLETLRGEQKKVRARIEKLLGQIDAISAG